MSLSLSQKKAWLGKELHLDAPLWTAPWGPRLHRQWMPSQRERRAPAKFEPEEIVAPQRRVRLTLKTPAHTAARRVRLTLPEQRGAASGGPAGTGPPPPALKLVLKLGKAAQAAQPSGRLTLSVSRKRLAADSGGGPEKCRRVEPGVQHSPTLCSQPSQPRAGMSALCVA